jgi:glycosyltransferase involved in cell wall biosynthesis
MLITVGICTFNRAESLRGTLDSLAAMRVASDLAWEIVLVNNNCTDHTDDLISQYIGRLPVRREFEPVPGKSNALNRVIDVARGEYIVWTDDDVLVDAGWLTAYAEAFRRWPDAAVFGGRIIPQYEVPVAKWVIKSEAVLDGPYAIRDFGGYPYPLSAADEDHFPFGANWAVRAVEQRAFRYNPELGPMPTKIRVQEDTDVIRRLLQSGATGYWIPNAIAHHRIGRERQTIRYIATYYEGWGETWAFRNASITVFAPFLFGMPRRIWPRLVVWWVLYRCSRFILPAPIWVQYLKAYSYNKGILRFWQQKRHLPPKRVGPEPSV